MAIELKNRLQAELGVEVPVINFLQGYNLNQITLEALNQLTTARSLNLAGAAEPEAAADNEWEVFTL
jgi:hypothetical protein